LLDLENTHKTKLLIVTFNFPYPVNHGGAIAQMFFIECLKKDYDLFLLTDFPEEDHVNEFRRVHPEINVYNWYKKPDAGSRPTTISAAKSVVRNIIQSGKKAKTAVYNYEDQLASQYMRNLVVVRTPGFIAYMNDIIFKEGIKIVQLEFFETLDLVEALPEKISKIFVEHEIRSKRVALAASYSSLPQAYTGYLKRLTELYEFQLLKKYDEIIVFTDEDAEFLKEKGLHASISPFAIPESMHFKSAPSGHFDKLIFLGSQSHKPNMEGLTWFLESIYLKNKAGIKWPIWIIGEWSDDFISKYSSDQVIFKGIVKSLEESFEASILVVPILSGSGLRTKILDALANNIPVFSTAFAGEGLRWQEATDKPFALFNNGEEFMEVIRHCDPDALKKLATDGHQFYRKHFNTRTLIDIRKHIYSGIENKYN
jgi:hypothetical protein